MSSIKEKKPELKLPKLKLKESNHFSQVWFEKSLVSQETSQNDKTYYIVNVDGNKIMFGTKAYINESKDGTKIGFFVQNSREYRIFGTTQMVTGKVLVQYSIDLNTFKKESK